MQPVNKSDTLEKRKELKKYLLSLSDADRAQYMYNHKISGGVVGLSPMQYPKSEPRRRPCDCGAEPVLVKTEHCAYVRCPMCGRQTEKRGSNIAAWYDWEDKKVSRAESDGYGTLSLFD